MSRTEKPNRDRELVSGVQGKRGQGVTLMGLGLLLGSYNCSESRRVEAQTASTIPW